MGMVYIQWDWTAIRNWCSESLHHWKLEFIWTIHIPSKNWKMLFQEKLQISQDKCSILCWEIFRRCWACLKAGGWYFSMQYGMLSCKGNSRCGILCENPIFDSCCSQGHKDTLYSLKITNESYTFCIMKLKLNSECSIILWFTMCCDPLIVENTI